MIQNTDCEDTKTFVATRVDREGNEIDCACSEGDSQRHGHVRRGKVVDNFVRGVENCGGKQSEKGARNKMHSFCSVLGRVFCGSFLETQSSFID